MTNLPSVLRNAVYVPDGLLDLEGYMFPFGETIKASFLGFPQLNKVPKWMEKALKIDGRFERAKMSAADIAFGRGSVRYHRDDIVGPTAVCLVYCEGGNDSAADFYHPSGVISGLKVGDILFFDDSENHGLSTNCTWAFVGLAIEEIGYQQ